MIETLIPAAPEVVTPETVTPLRPSVALRLGRLARPVRIDGFLFGGPGEACPLGAILTGYGKDGGEYGDLPAAFWEPPTACPAGGRSTCDMNAYLLDVVFHLNDIHEWSDSQIAGYLQGLGL